MNPTSKGGWKPGQSGNPKGKPPGSGELQKLRASIGAHVPEIIDQLVTQAKGGDVQAARLLLERVLAPIKATEQTVTVSLPEDQTLTAKATAVLNAAASGDLAPSQAAQLITALGTVAKITEIDELEIRIAKLEERHAKH